MAALADLEDVAACWDGGTEVYLAVGAASIVNLSEQARELLEDGPAPLV